MPIYEFRCSKCNKRFEEIMSSNDDKKIFCCNKETEKLMSIPSIKIGFRPFRSQCIDEHNKHIIFHTQKDMEEYHKKNNLVIER